MAEGRGGDAQLEQLGHWLQLGAGISAEYAKGGLPKPAHLRAHLALAASLGFDVPTSPSAVSGAAPATSVRARPAPASVFGDHTEPIPGNRFANNATRKIASITGRRGRGK